MGIFNKNEPKLIKELANFCSTPIATAGDYPLSEEFSSFKRGFEKLAKRQIKKCKTDFLNYDLLDSRIDSVAEEQKAQNNMKYVTNCIANRAVSQQVAAYEEVNNIYITLLDEIIKEGNDE